MNLLFLMIKNKAYFLLSAIFLLIIGILYYIYPDILKESELDKKSIADFILYANRLVIFIFGLTVSANIYLYTTRNNISSSIMWLSNQIGFLIVTIMINIITLMLGSIVIYYDFFSNIPLSFGKTKLFIVIYLGLFLASVMLFLFTLAKFVSVFKIDSNMSKAIKKIQSKIYPVQPLRVYKEKKQIADYSRSVLEKYKQKNGFKKILKYTCYNKLIKFSIIQCVFEKTDVFSASLIEIYTYVKIVVFRRNKFLVRTLPYSRHELEFLNLQIEIYTQNLEYIIKKNSNKSMTQHFTQWNAAFSQLIVMVFHINSTSNKIDNVIDLYKAILNHHSKLIIATSKNYEHQHFNQQLILSLFTGLAYREEAYHNVTKKEFEKRTKTLEEIYFKELFTLFVSLIKEEDFEFVDLLQTEGLSVNSFMSTDKDNEKFYGDRIRKERYEELFVSTLIKMIELNITHKISAVMAILLSLKEDIQKNENSTSGQILTSTKKKHVQLPEPVAGNLNLSHKNKVGLYFATIKANELENYKAAGYLVKVLSTNLTHSSLENVMYEISSDRSEKRNMSYHTGIYKLDFNDFSYQYCVDKTLLLFISQYYFKGKIVMNNKIKHLLKETDNYYFLKKIEDKQKEYNMLSLNSKNIKTLEFFLKRVI